jgi:hypothetical protein
MSMRARGGTRVLWLSLLAALVLAGCGGGSDAPAGAASTPAATMPTTSTPTASTPPVITGTPAASVIAGQAYSFTPAVSGADHDVLGFSVANKPAWATFNTVTGGLTGTPTAASVGDYPGIRISVSDGTATAALTAFAIRVMAAVGTSPPPPMSGSATLSWTVPTLNTDGSPLTNLAGYRIYYGTDSTALAQTANIDTADTTSYAVSGLSSGTWYFAISAYTTAGTESVLSNLASKTI